MHLHGSHKRFIEVYACLRAHVKNCTLLSSASSNNHRVGIGGGDRQHAAHGHHGQAGQVRAARVAVGLHLHCHRQVGPGPVPQHGHDRDPRQCRLHRRWPGFPAGAQGNKKIGAIYEIRWQDNMWTENAGKYIDVKFGLIGGLWWRTIIGTWAG